MRLIIEGREYLAVQPGHAPTLHMVELQQQARRVDQETGEPLIDGGLGMRAISAMKRELMTYRRELLAWQASAPAGGRPDPETEPDLPDCSPIFNSIAVYLAMRGAGERLTLMDALSIPSCEIEFAPDPEDDTADPTTPAQGTTAPAGPETPDVAAAPARKRTTRGRSTTSVSR